MDGLFDFEQILRPLHSNVSRDNKASDSILLQDDLEGNAAGVGTLAVVAGLFERSVAPVVVIAGLIGNLIALFVFSERSMQRRSSNVYLTGISLAGVGFLACVTLSWTAHTSINVYEFDGACQILTYVTYVSSFLGVWYVVCFTVERYVAVHYPLRRLSLCTATKARRTVIALALFAGVAYHYAAWTSGVIEPWPGGGRICVPQRRYTPVMSVVYVVDTVVTLLLPFVVITLLNVRIAVTVFRHNRDRQAMASRAVPLRRYTWTAFDHDRDRLRLRRYIRTHVGHRRSPNDQFRVTKLLLTISVAFLALNLPRHATRAYNLAASAADDHYRPSLTFLACEKLFNVVYYTHFAVNIVLYAAVSGKKFRSALRRRCRGLC